MKRTKIETRIMNEVMSYPSRVFCLKDIRVRCSYSAKTKTVSLMLAEGYIGRIINGIYYIRNKPMPSFMEICFAIGRKNEWRVCPLPQDWMNPTQLSDHQILVKSTGPSRVYNLGGTEVRFLKESRQFLPSVYYTINLLAQFLKMCETTDVSPDYRREGIKKLARLLTKEEYIRGLDTLETTTDEIKSTLNMILSEEPHYVEATTLNRKGRTRKSRFLNMKYNIFD